MAWFTLEEVAQRGPSWQEQIAAGQVTTYTDAQGRHLVWMEDPEAADGLAAGLACLRSEMGAMRQEMRAMRISLEKMLESASRRRPAPRPKPPLAITLRPEREERNSEQLALLEQVAEGWSGSDRELERRAGLPKAFLAKAKRGERGGPRSASSWARLAAFLERRAA